MEKLSLGSRGKGVKEVQALLVKLGYDMNVDGAFGPITAMAVSEFQAFDKLKKTGEVDAVTLAEIKKAVELSSDSKISRIGLIKVVPSLGFYHYSPGPNSGPVDRGKWAHCTVKDKIHDIGYKLKSKGISVGLGDISLKDGGPFTSILDPKKLVHHSHENGKDVDFRMIRKDGREAPCSIGKDYDQLATEEFIKILRSFLVSSVFFNDKDLIAKYSFVKYVAGHNDHIHARFK